MPDHDDVADVIANLDLDNMVNVWQDMHREHVFPARANRVVVNEELNFVRARVADRLRINPIPQPDEINVPVQQVKVNNMEKINCLFDDAFDPDSDVIKLEEDGDLAFQLAQLKRKYTGTWCYVNDKLTYIGGFTTSNSKMYVKIDGVFKPFNEVVIKPAWLQGLYNFKERVIYLERSPNRQWYRSLHNENTEFSEPTWPIVQQIQKQIRKGIIGQFSFERANELFVPVSYNDAIAQLIDLKAFARAFHQKYFVSLSYDNNDKLLLWRGSQLIGYVMKNKPDMLICNNNDYREELIDNMKGIAYVA